MPNNKQPPRDAAELRRRAEEQLHRQQTAEADAPRLLHELQVHQIELEMQNSELLETKERLESMLDRYTDLYEFAPIGFFTLDVSGRILETNLTGTNLLGLERSLVIGQQLGSFFEPDMQGAFRNFLEAVFEGAEKLSCEVAINRAEGRTIWVDLQGSEGTSGEGSRRFCRLAASDITPLKRGEEARSRVAALNQINQDLQLEIERRKTIEKDLRESEREQAELLKQAQQLQEELRHMSHLILHAQEEERRRISLDLHDEIAQTLVGINVHLSALVKEPSMQEGGIREKIADTQKLVEDSVSQVHRFAMKLRPPVLDDLGLVPALKSYLKEFTGQTQIPVEFKTNSRLEKLSKERCTILYRVAQEALSNVAQHAQASQAGLHIKKGKKSLSMEIHDDGKSFDVERDLRAAEGQRIGVIGMRERMEMVEGEFQIVSSPGNGTTVTVTMPLTKLRGKKKKSAR